MSAKTKCTKCKMIVCITKNYDQGSENCPAKTKQDVIQNSKSKYAQPEIREFARQAILQHNEAILKLPEGGMIPRNPRVEEIAQFAKKMGYRKIGIAFCSALRKEAQVVGEILENRGFDVISVCCTVGNFSVETVGITEDQKLGGPGSWQPMCNPITQAEILNDEEVEFNIAVGLCVGHDSLFFMHAKAPTTVLIVKDRVFGNNPVVALHEAKTFYRWLLRKETLDT
jgi:uncharacterized metal-binding protein